MPSPSTFIESAGPRDAIVVRDVASRRDIDQFVTLPWSLYANDPQWVPPLLVEVKEFINPKKHPFYHHGAATPLVAYRGEKAVGRILVSDDPHYNEAHGTNLGCFGLFESVDDPKVAASLLDAAANWLRARGRTAILGPIDYSTNYQCGLLIDGFDTPPRVLMNHNPPFYARLLEAWGLTKAKDLYSWWFDDSNDMITRWKRKTDWLARRGKIVIRSFQTKDFEAEVRRCCDVYCEAYEHNWGFVRLTHEEFHYFAEQLRRVAVPEQVLIAEFDGQPVGFAVTLPDVNEAIRPLNGRLTKWGLPIGLARLLYRLPRVRTARMMILVVLQGFRRRGISELLILNTLAYGKSKLHYTTAELGWTLEDNHLINRTIEAVGGKRYKTHRIYERAI
jgi:GNAT superfamily N-acetyltransferase